ncbi:SusC/RagA family TonB-linked outer membrane protein [Olivibacter sp. SDN3]|uniref:SusC/RagA family TonB-linked outer membrane protein n=1 Tax=Olivibacter sp. SDN3 TaxID=2764720 RepID=UPI0016515F77|nr:SusC/RagA family TonB-linked outer membrane protein [Olivibacter sp. SDN3]QNL49191.1 SusC/RagA family TonB-linked outer membrane protein [Olivibacter sp. SDN3]
MMILFSLDLSVVHAKITPKVITNEVKQESFEISGIVKDENGEPLPGVTIALNGKATTRTGINGEFSLKAPNNSTLSASMIGYQMYTTTITKAESQLAIMLSDDANELNEVVVTALGIKRESKALGYAVSTVRGSDISEAMPNNWTDGLKGKVAGLNLTQAGSGPINSTRINLRGDRSLNPAKNEALIVVDGVPMINGRVSSGVDQAYGAGATGEDKDVPVDFGNGLSDINPDDIESVTVLKGAAAAALYGSRAGNGALIITTKKGSRKNGLGITINSNNSINDVLRWPDYQYEYGQGNLNRNSAGDLYYSYGLSEDGANTGSTSSAFGPKFMGQSYFQYDPSVEGQSASRQPWRPYEDNIKDFWRTGYTLTNSVAVDGAGDRFSGRASITHTKNEWIMPNTGFERLVASFNSSLQLTDKLTINTKVSYTNKNSDNLPATGYNNQSIAYFMIFQNPNVDLKWYEPRWQNGLDQIQQIHPFSSYIENPYVIAHDMTNSLDSYNMDGNLQAHYAFNDKWNLMLRSGLNMRQDRRTQRRPFSSANFPQGYYKEQDVYFYESNTDALLTYTEDLSSRIKMTASLGGNLLSSQIKESVGVARGLVIPGIYKLSNAANQALAEFDLSRRNLNSVYALTNFSFDEKVYVDVTARNDWASSLPRHNHSFFYPSISSSYILSDIFQLPRQISFAKARLSWAQVGNDTDPYQTAKYYATSAFPGSSQAPSVLFNADLKPEISTSWEAGLNFALFNNRITSDVNFYTNRTVNQVLLVPLDVTTGYSQAFINGGTVRNQGIELMFTGTPLASQNFTWNSTITWAKNVNKILELSDDIGGDQQIIAQSGTASVIAKVGGTTGDIYGFGLVRNEDGEVVFDAQTGLALRPNDIQKIGTAYPDWRGGFLNEFNYKNFRMSVLLDGQYGGIVYSQSFHKMSEQGKLTHTLAGRETGQLVGEGVVQNADGSYSPNTTPVNINTWYGDYYRRANIETNSFDASYIKLREVRIEYTFPQSLVSRWRLNGASVAIFGRDLAMISKFPVFDPETAALNGAVVMPGVEMGQLPTPRTWGLNLRLQL